MNKFFKNFLLLCKVFYFFFFCLTMELNEKKSKNLVNDNIRLFMQSANKRLKITKFSVSSSFDWPLTSPIARSFFGDSDPRRELFTMLAKLKSLSTGAELHNGTFVKMTFPRLYHFHCSFLDQKLRSLRPVSGRIHDENCF